MTISNIKKLNFLRFNFNKPFYQNLKQIYGLGNFYKKEFLFRLGYSQYGFLKIKEVNSFLLSRLYKFSKLFIKTYNFRFRKLQKLLRLQIKIKAIKVIHLKNGFPVNNQRRRTNGKTAKRLNKNLYILLNKKK